MTPDMSSQEFAQLAAQNHQRIPVMREILADLETPLSCYLKLARGPYTYLFESVEGGEKWGRYSLIGLPSSTVLKICGHQWILEKNGAVIEERTVQDPLAEIEAFQQQFNMPERPDLP
ncbi:MAG: anthranilate synthase component I, partial [Porticoccaceae bacterium]|nr:anthranilate synthase component I [Porticoccaceae bacterium]